MKRAAVTYDIAAAALADEARHPVVVVRLFCHGHGIEITAQAEQVLAQTFTFEMQTFEPAFPPFPPYMTARLHR